MPAAFKVTKARHEDGEVIDATYFYRDIEFKRIDRIPAGYFGRYRIRIPKTAPFSQDAPTQAQVKSIIDQYIEWKAAQ